VLYPHRQGTFLNVITTVAFDADETLVATGAAVKLALESVTALVGDPELPYEVWRADGRHYWATMPEKHARVIRTNALRHTLARVGREAEADEVAEHFFKVRLGNTRPFPGVVETLTELRPQYTLGYATNGNSLSHLCGLEGFFAFEIYAHDEGLVPKKPSPVFYEAMLECAGATPDQFVYVGDDYENDVVGPKAAGMRGVWVNPQGLPVPGETRPDAVIENLAELPRILAGWR
jgi:putative hydrolase of the HAD superfamily